jgi:hydroxypyruvate reductase
LYSIGKAAHTMAAGAVTALERSLHPIAGGVIVAPESTPTPYATVASLPGDHPLPGRRSFTAAERIGETAAGMRSDDVAIVLLSGGATSLIAAPLRGMSESDIGHLFELLLGSGLDITDMNTVRKRFTRWGAGRLALALAPARTHALVISDVVGNDPEDIGSGPCTPDSHSVREVIELLRRADLYAQLSPAMREYLTGVSRGVIPETPKPSHPAFAHVRTRVIGANHLALDAAVARARELAVAAEPVRAPLRGEAARCGEAIADTLLQRAERDQLGCVVWGGETTVQLGKPSPPFAHLAVGGRFSDTRAMAATGGRCQELALAAAKRLAGGGAPARRITILAAGTDGRDGPTDAAGAFADAALWETIARSGHDPEHALTRHESYAALAAAGALLHRGLTGTNVMDVVIGVVE